MKIFWLTTIVLLVACSSYCEASGPLCDLIGKIVDTFKQTFGLDSMRNSNQNSMAPNGNLGLQDGNRNPSGAQTGAQTGAQSGMQNGASNGVQPNGAQQNVAQPTGVQPNVAQPNGAQQNVVQPNVAQPTGAQPNVVQP